MVAVPLPLAVTNPLPAFTVAIPLSDELQFPASPSEVRFIVPLIPQISAAPDSVPAFGAAVTVTTLVA